MNNVSTRRAAATADNIPAEFGVWLFLLADMAIFAIYFWVFVWYQAQYPDVFAAGQASLNTFYGGFNTLVLLTSSYFAISAVNASRRSDLHRFRRNIWLTIVCGLIFLVVKTLEYGEKFTAGFHIASDSFYTFYFTFTGFHLVHVILGLSFMAYLLFAVREPAALKTQSMQIEGSALYWHMVDLLWVILFSLIYLVQ